MTHHIVPRAFQGDSSEENLMILCANCHKIIHSDFKVKIKEWTLEKAKYRESFPKPPKPKSIEEQIKNTLEKIESEPTHRSKIHILLDIVEMLEKKMGRPVPKEEVISVAEEQGIKAEEVDELLRRLKIEGSIFEPKINYIERILP